MKIYLSTIALVISCVTGHAQNKLVQSVNRINLDLFQTGLNYSREFPVADRSTVEGRLGVSSHYYTGDFAMQFSPQIAVDYKFYYNIARKNEKGKNINNNSASFIGATAFSDLFPLNKLEQSENKNFLLGAAVFWGIRHQIGNSGFQLNFLAGPALGTDGLSDKNFALYLKTGIAYCF